MMTRAFFALIILVAASGAMTSAAWAVDPPDLFLEHLAEFGWTGSGDGTSWQSASNWTAPTFPDGYPYVFLPPELPEDPYPYPHDPGRVDTDQVAIWPAVGANLSVPLTGNLSVS